jgi:hypothetical protein
MIHETSMQISCPFDNWDSEKMIIHDSEEYFFWDNQASMKQIGLAQ